jgi:hypothetical protein
LSLELPNSTNSLGTDYHHVTAADLSSSSSTSAGSGIDKKARLLYCKSHVSIHPTSLSKDNIKGYLGVVEVDAPGASTVDSEGNVSGGSTGGKELLVTWVPEEVVQRMDEGDRAGYQKVDSWTSADKGDQEEDGNSSCFQMGSADPTGFVFVSIPPPKGEKYAFSVPVSQLYSILVYSVRLAFVNSTTWADCLAEPVSLVRIGHIQPIRRYLPSDSLFPRRRISSARFDPSHW